MKKPGNGKARQMKTRRLNTNTLNLIEGSEGLTSPRKPIIELSTNAVKVDLSAILIVDCLSRSLIYGSKTIRILFKGGRNKTWDFIRALIVCRSKKMPLSRISAGMIENHIDWKNQYDTLALRLGGYAVLKQFIVSNGYQYILTDNVQVINHSSVRAKSGTTIDHITPSGGSEP